MANRKSLRASRKTKAKSSPTISPIRKRIGTVPSHRALALLRGRREGMLDVTLRLDTEAEKPKWDAPHNPCEGRIAARFGIRNTPAVPADKWLARYGALDVAREEFHAPGVGIDGRCCVRRAEARCDPRVLRAEPESAAAGRTGRSARDDGPGSGPAHGRQGGRGRYATGKVVDTGTSSTRTQPKNDWDGCAAYAGPSWLPSTMCR